MRKGHPHLANLRKYLLHCDRIGVILKTYDFIFGSGFHVAGFTAVLVKFYVCSTICLRRRSRSACSGERRTRLNYDYTFLNTSIFK